MVIPQRKARAFFTCYKTSKRDHCLDLPVCYSGIGAVGDGARVDGSDALGTSGTDVPGLPEARVLREQRSLRSFFA